MHLIWVRDLKFAVWFIRIRGNNLHFVFWLRSWLLCCISVHIFKRFLLDSILTLFWTTQYSHDFLLSCQNVHQNAHASQLDLCCLTDKVFHDLCPEREDRQLVCKPECDNVGTDFLYLPSSLEMFCQCKTKQMNSMHVLDFSMNIERPT